MADEITPGVNKAADAAINSVSFFIMSSEVFKQIENNAREASDSSSKIVTLFKEFLGETVGSKLEKITEEAKQRQAQATPVEKERIAATKKGSFFDLAKLALLIPLLLNDEARKYFASFLSGLLGIETLEKIETALKLVGVVLATIFAVKVFKEVARTLNAFIRLSRLVGALFLLSEATGDLSQKEKKRADRRREAERKRNQKRRQNRRKKIARIRKLKKIISSIKKGILIGGPLGILAGAIFSIGIGAVLDYVSDADEKDADEEDKFDEKDDDEDTDVPEVSDELETTSITDLLIKNAKEEILGMVTLGLVTPESFNRSVRALRGDEKALEENRAEIRGAVSESDIMTSLVTPSETDTSIQKETPPKPLTGTMDLDVHGLGFLAPQPEQPNIPIYSSPGFSISIIPGTGTSTDGARLSTDSEDVVSAKKDLRSTTNVNNIIDNSVVIVSPEENNNPNAIYNYSRSLGR